MGRNYIDFKPESLKKFDSIFKEYSTKASEDNLNSLLELYEMLKPNWVKEFNDFNENLSKRKTTNNEVYDKFLEVQLPEEYSIEELKAPKNRDNNSFMDIMQRGRIIHLSNKIAHVFEKVIENKISAYMTKNGIEIDDKEKDFKDINNLIRGIYSPRTNERKKNYLISKLYLYGFELSDFEKGKNLDIMNFPELIEAYNNAMFIKDTEIENVDTLVFDYDRRDISYGIQEAEKVKQYLLWIYKDLDNFLFI